MAAIEFAFMNAMDGLFTDSGMSVLRKNRVWGGFG